MDASKPAMFRVARVRRAQDGDGQWRVRFGVAQGQDEKLVLLTPIFGDHVVEVRVYTYPKPDEDKTAELLTCFQGTLHNRRQTASGAWDVTIYSWATESEAIEKLAGVSDQELWVAMRAIPEREDGDV